MNTARHRRLSLAAVLAAVTALIHLFAGTAEVHQPLLNSALPRELSLLLYACWHLVSCALLLSAIALAVAAKAGGVPRYVPMTRLVSALWLASGLVFLVLALLFAGEGMLLKLPQWTLLLPVGLLAWPWRRRRTARDDLARIVSAGTG